MKLTLIGNGMMSQSLIAGLIEKYEIEVIGRSFAKLQRLQQKFPSISIKVIKEQEDITNKNIILCVKPNALQSVALYLTGTCNLLYSILAGISIESLKQQIKAKSYIRAMPNIAASKKKSMTTITGDNLSQNEAMTIFNFVGKTIWVENENKLDIATSVAGSGPAFLSLVAEAIIDGAVKQGLERNIAAELTQGLFEGTSELLKDNHPAFIKDCVTSPAGTTSQGLAKLEERAVRDAFIKAIEAAYLKAIEVGKK